jgi:hypothetical protein
MNEKVDQRAEIEHEADRLIAGSQKHGLREHILAWLLYTAGLPVDVRCPRCNDVLTVTSFPNGGGEMIQCKCGHCAGAMRGL